MAIIKRGDDMPIKGIFDADGEEQTCPTCGDKLLVIAVEGNNNKLVCSSCEANEDSE